ncbi:hypothetical protein CHARACLAT_019343 [Characodon lateralis]|uniref:Uncharacterized protein n=1 Tax=Characodon lateralis TaxID=208331 RepID=A0ABU7DI40_9TELE|nr:hypothetical protein [Characodon lateralis]
MPFGTRGQTAAQVASPLRAQRGVTQKQTCPGLGRGRKLAFMFGTPFFCCCHDCPCDWLLTPSSSTSLAPRLSSQSLLTLCAK